MRTYLRFALPVIALVFSGQIAPRAQQAARDTAKAATVGTASIVGTIVIDEPNNPPLRRAAVSTSIRSTTAIAQRQTTTDDQGRFVLANLPAGTYSAPRVTKGAFVPAVYGEKRPNGIGTPITLADGQRVSITMKVLRGAVITGMVHDNGRPIVTSVTASPIAVVNGVLTATATYRGGNATSDDRGIYRIHSLPPGTYVISATPRSTGAGELRPITEAEIQWAQRQLQPGGSVSPGAAPSNVPPPPAQPIAFTPVFYPGTANFTDAAVVSVTAGQERSGIDFGLAYVPTAKIEGVILNPDGQTATGAQMNLVPMMDAGSPLLNESFFLIDSVLLARPTVTAGRFTMANVRPGRYTLAARAPASAGPGPGGGRGGPPPAMTLWATAELSVDGVDQQDIVLRLQPGMDLTGRIVFEPGTLQPPTDLSRMTVRLAAAPTAGVSVSVNLPGAAVAADGRFELQGIAPGKYHLSSFVPAASAGAGASWTLKSAKVGDVDAADSPFEVRPGQSITDVVLTFTDKSSELSGTLLDAKGQPTTALSIILFSTDRAMWSQRSRRLRFPARPGTDGKFRFTGLVPGEYYLAALSDFEQADISKPEFLEQVAAAAMKITIAEGEKKVQDLKIAGG